MFGCNVIATHFHNALFIIIIIIVVVSSSSSASSLYKHNGHEVIMQYVNILEVCKYNYKMFSSAMHWLSPATC